MKKKILCLCALLWIGAQALSQNSDSLSKRWALETELIQPFIPTVHIFHVQAAYKFPAIHSDLLIGAYIRPNVKHDVVEKINEYMFFIGYRQYLWKGLHLEAKSNMGYAWGTKNLVDGKDYNTPTWFWEANVGYQIALGKRFYCIPQAGILSKIIADIGPRNGKPDTFPNVNLIVGFKL